MTKEEKDVQIALGTLPNVADIREKAFNTLLDTLLGTALSGRLSAPDHKKIVGALCEFNEAWWDMYRAARWEARK